ncbi:MAG: hypothetical protein FJ011_01190 [Chloroflexi bacterium]|nr:hypothetical protein [Chloroflexota bacterium]
MGGNLTIAIAGLTTLDVKSVNQGLVNAVIQSVYETLTDRGPDGKIIDTLIKERQISADGLVHTWKLREGVKFHDGADFNAAAVKWNLDQKYTDKYYSSVTNQIPLDKTEVVDPMTVKVTLKGPCPQLYSVLAVKSFAMYSPAFFEKVGKDAMKTQASGTGPFMVESYTPNESLKLKKNPNYWQKGKPYVDTLTYKIVPDPNARATMLEAGEVDIADGLSFQDAERLKSNANVQVITQPQSRQYYVSLTVTHPPLDNVNVRKAINLAVDREAIVKNIFRGYARVAQTFLANDAVEPVVNTGPYPYNPAQAKELLDKEGWKPGSDGIRVKDGKRLVLQLRTTKTDADRWAITELVQGSLKEIGIEVNVNVDDNAVFLAQVNKPIAEAPPYDMLVLTWGTFTGDAAYPIGSGYSCKAFPPVAYNYSHLCDKDLEKLIDDAALAPTMEKRNEIYTQVMKKMFDLYPVLNLVNSTGVSVSRKYVRGIYIDPGLGQWPAKWVWLDK